MLKDLLKPSNDYNPNISSNTVLQSKVLSDVKDKYLVTDNHLSEYDSEVGKKKVRDNLEVYSKEGVNGLIYDIKNIVDSSKISQVNADIDDNIGNPEVDVNFSNNILSFNFRNLKGKSFTYDDLTEEQKAELARPGVEAVGDVKTELNNNITQGVNLLKGSDTTLLDNISTWQISSASIEGKQNDGWWRVEVPNGTTDGEIFIEQDISLPVAGKYTFSCEIKSDGDLSAHVRFHAVNYDYSLIIDRIDELSEHHYRVVGSFNYDENRGIRKFDIYHINAPNSTYIDIRFPILSQADDYIPWQPSIYDLTAIRQEQKQSSSLDDAPSDGYTYGRNNGKWVKIKTDYEQTLYVLDLTNSSSVEDIKRIVGSPQELIDLASKYNLFTGLYAYGIDSIPIHVTYSESHVLIECSYIKPASTFLVATRITLQYTEGNTWTGVFVDTNDK